MKYSSFLNLPVKKNRLLDNLAHRPLSHNPFLKSLGEHPKTFFLGFYADTQLASQEQQQGTQVVCGHGNKEAWKRLTELNGTPAMDLGLGTHHVCRYRGMCMESNVCGIHTASASDTPLIDHLVMREFVSGPPSYRFIYERVRDRKPSLRKGS